MIEDDIKSLILPVCPNITAINLPDKSPLPACTYRIVSTVEQYTMDGPLGLIQVRLQIDSYGQLYTNAKALSVAIRNILNGYTGTLSNGCQIADIRRDGEQSGFDENARSFYVQTDWLVLYSE